jgi:hypothetical protein
LLRCSEHVLGQHRPIFGFGQGLLGFHSFHELLEVFLGVSLGFISRFIEPFGFAFLTLVPVPSTIVLSFSDSVMLCFDMVVSPISPTLRSVETLPCRSRLRLLRSFVVVSTPWIVRAGLIQTVSANLIIFISLLLFGELAKIAAGTVRIAVTIFRFTRSAVSYKAIGTGTGGRPVAHAPMKTFSTFIAKALTRLHGGPTITILITVTAAAEVGSVITISFAKAFTGLGLTITGPECEAVSSVDPAIFGGLVIVKGFRIPQECSRIERCSRWPKDYILRI